MEKPTLVILAAGMGSRYGSLKQMDGVGPSGEAILDYSIYDAARAGFGRVVFVIRRQFENDFKEVFPARRYPGMDVSYAFQELDALPEGFTVPAGRERPWGTNHAVMCGAQGVKGPFAVINADDFYGRDAFARMAGALAQLGEKEFCMVGYKLANTLSDNGTVSRGVCQIDPDGFLVSVTERTAIARRGGSITYREDEAEYPLDADCTVSMNLFGFTPQYVELSSEAFAEFLSGSGNDLKAEFYIPTMVNRLIADGYRFRVIETTSQWFGVTYKEDRPVVRQRIQELTENGEYPEKLWK